MYVFLLLVLFICLFVLFCLLLFLACFFLLFFLLVLLLSFFLGGGGGVGGLRVREHQYYDGEIWRLNWETKGKEKYGCKSLSESNGPLLGPSRNR